MTTTKLPDFEGAEVRKSTVRITRAGDGLSEALKFEPIALHHGQRCYFVLEGVVTQVNHKPDGKVDLEEVEVDDLVRVHTVEASEIALVEEDDVAELLRLNRDRLDTQRREREREEQRQREEEAGMLQIPGPDDEDDPTEVLERQHNAGAHAEGLREGCPQCEAEKAAAAEEAGGATHTTKKGRAK